MPNFSSIRIKKLMEADLALIPDLEKMKKKSEKMRINEIATSILLPNGWFLEGFISDSEMG